MCTTTRLYLRERRSFWLKDKSFKREKMRGFSMNSNGPFLYLYLELEVREKKNVRFG